MSRRFPGVVSLSGDLELNEKLMGERCGGILEDACERVSLEVGVMEELIFFGEDEDETEKVSGVALDDSWTKDSDSRDVSPAGVNYGSELVEEEVGDCVGESGITFDPGADSTWTSGTGVDSDHLGLDDGNETVLAVGDAYGDDLAWSMEQNQASVGGLPGRILGVESVDLSLIHI